MTVFDFDKEEQGDWFAFFTSRVDPVSGEVVYNPPEEGAAEFRIRSMAPFFEERQKNRKRESKMVLNPATRQMERVSWIVELDPEEDRRENEDAWDYAITGIRNAFDPAGDPIECTRENKMKLVRMPAFIRFARRVFELILEYSARKKEEDSKNL